MLRKKNQKEFIKLLEAVNSGYRNWEKFKDFCELTALTMQLPFYSGQTEKLNALRQRYDDEDIKTFDMMLELVVETLTDGFCDFLGEIFNKLGLSDKWKGQLMTTKEAAAFLGTSVKEVLRLHNEGLLRRAKGFNSPFRFSQYHIEEYLRGGIKLKE